MLGDMCGREVGGGWVGEGGGLVGWVIVCEWVGVCGGGVECVCWCVCVCVGVCVCVCVCGVCVCVCVLCVLCVCCAVPRATL